MRKVSVPSSKIVNFISQSNLFKSGRSITLGKTKFFDYQSKSNYSNLKRFNVNNNSSSGILKSNEYSSKRSYFNVFGGVVGLGASGLLFTFLNNRDDYEEKNVVFAAEAVVSSDLAQSTVVTGTHPYGGFVTITLSSKADLKKVVSAASKLPVLIEDVSGVSPSDKKFKNAGLPPLMAGVAFGTQVWEKIVNLYKLSLPQNFGHYASRKGQFGDMPATGGDILLHVKGESQSLCIETIKSFISSLPAGSVEKVEDMYGFQYQEGRDLSGFLDGTENPADLITRSKAALLPDGGSYVIHQRWIHNIRDFESKSISEQEKIVGRSKPDSAEIPFKEMSKTAHVMRTRDQNFQKIPIVRQSMPFVQSLGEQQHGLLFIAYSNSLNKFDVMLDRMVGKSGGSENDAIMTFSKCIRSNYYYAPSLKQLSSFK